jgi:hypothetical protein
VGVTITSAGPSTSSGRYSAPVVTSGQSFAISNELFDLGNEFPLAANQTFPSVTGIVTYFYSFQLAPRSIADFEGGVAPDAGK